MSNPPPFLWLWPHVKSMLFFVITVPNIALIGKHATQIKKTLIKPNPKKFGSENIRPGSLDMTEST